MKRGNKPDGFVEYRYMKPKTHHAPKIAFKFDITYSSTDNKDATMRFSYAICNVQDNFSRKYARDLLDKRMDNGEVVICVFDNNKTLVECAMDAVENVIDVAAADVNFKESLKNDPKNQKNFNNIKKLKLDYQEVMDEIEFEEVISELLDSGKLVTISADGIVPNT